MVLQMEFEKIAQDAIQLLTIKLRSHFTVDPTIEY